MPVTIRDIAKKLNISHSTVSRIINHRESDFISADTRTSVLRVAEEMGSRPNYHARSLHSGRSMAVGLVLDSSSIDPFWQSMFSGVEDGARALGYDLVIIGPAHGQSALERAMTYCSECRVDALVVPGYLSSLVGSEILANFSGPAVIAGTPQTSKFNHISVDLDLNPGIDAAVEHLAQLGHRNILWFDAHSQVCAGALARCGAFRRAAVRLGLNGVEARMGTEDAKSAEQCVESARRHFPAALEQNPKATAVMCFNEATAFGVYAQLAQLGKAVPQHMSVIGFDDIHAIVASPSMTVVSHMLNEIGRRAVELAIELSRSMGNGPDEERRQTGCAPASGPNETCGSKEHRAAAFRILRIAVRVIQKNNLKGVPMSRAHCSVTTVRTNARVYGLLLLSAFVLNVPGNCRRLGVARRRESHLEKYGNSHGRRHQ